MRNLKHLMCKQIVQPNRNYYWVFLQPYDFATATNRGLNYQGLKTTNKKHFLAKFSSDRIEKIQPGLNGLH